MIMDSTEFLTRLLEIESPTGSVSRAVDYVISASRRLGFQVHVDEASNCIITTHPLRELGLGGAVDPERSEEAGPGSSPSPRFTIFLVSHLDTVPGFPEVRLEGDVLTGRGAVDAKGPFSAFLFSALPFIGDPHIQIAVIGVPDEEGSSKGAKYLARSPSPDCCIIGEPSGTNGITLGYKGMLRATLSFRSRVEHTSCVGDNAVERAIAFWLDLKRHCEARQKDTVFMSPTPHLHSLNTSDDGLTRSATISVSVRMPPMPSEGDRDKDVEKNKDVVYEKDMDPDRDGEASLECKIRALAEAGAGIITHIDQEPAVLSDKTSFLVRAFLPSIREQSLSPRFVKKLGTCDMNILQASWGCPMVAYGPGDSNLDHTDGEMISLREYETAIRVLRGTLGRLKEGHVSGVLQRSLH